MVLVVKVVPESDEAVYEQIARQIRAGVGSGALQSGARLPSVRTLATDLGINLNTVARAYRLLQEEGFVTIQSRRGVCVASPSTTVKEGTSQYLHSQLRAVLQRMRQSGLLPEDLRALATQEIERLSRAPELKS
jgi:GntR family transcriptional regulator